MMQLTRRHLLSAMSAAGIASVMPGCAPMQSRKPHVPGRKDSIGVALVGLGYYASELLAPALLVTSLR